jgi:hypothetical protein
MIYLVRTFSFLKYDESLEEATTQLTKHLKKNYPQIKDLKMLWNVTGPINQSHWVFVFDSLATEDEWAGKIIQDEVYLNWFMKSEGSVGPIVDRLYRDMPDMG